MGLEGLPYTLLQIPFAAGLEQKFGAQSRPNAALDIARDIEFDEIGQLRLRKPFAQLGTAIVGGGALADLRALQANGDELLCFTKDSLYSYQQAAPAGWVRKGTYVAAAVDEKDAFDAPTDQYDADRAELAGVVFFTWADSSGTWIAARDKVTGSMIVAPTLVGLAFTRPRLVALTTKVLFFYESNADAVFAASIDPANPVGSIAGGAFASTVNVFGGTAQAPNYDVVRIAQTDSAAIVMQHAGAASYDVALVTAALAVTKANKARACDGAIAIAASPDAAFLQIVRSQSTITDFSCDGDLLDAVTLADVFTATNFAGPPIVTEAGYTQANQQIACAYRDVLDGGHYRCYLWFSASPVTYSMWVDTANNTGGMSFGPVYDVTIKHVSLASRAFARDGHVYAWTVFDQASSFPGANSQKFSAQLQNTYFLYRDDGLLCSIASDGTAGGAPPTVSLLPGVASTDGLTYRWCGARKRRVVIGSQASQVGYNDERTPRDITLTYDDNRARRGARLGLTFYLPGGEVMQYDGVGLYELGFHVYPWHFGLQDDATAGNIAAGTYANKFTWRWGNAVGETERSATATVSEVVVAADNHQVTYATADHLYGLCQTHKLAAPPIAEWWRTLVSPVEESPFYLASSTVYGQTGPNGYLRCVPPADALMRGFGAGLTTDNFADATLGTKQANPENDGVLENLAPPPATLMVASDTRMFIAGVAGLPDTVYYSKQRAAGELAAFNDQLQFDVPREGGKITGIWIMNETLVVARETAIYSFPGDGFDNTGGGQNYGPARIVSLDVGVRTQQSVRWTEKGIVFQSKKGWQLLNFGWTIDYIGAPISDFDAEDALAVHVMTAQQQVRIVTANRVLVWDYLVGQWCEWTIAGALDAAMWNGSYVYLDPVNGPMIEQADYSAGVAYAIDVETAWIKLNDMQARGYVRLVQVLGEYLTAHRMRVRVAKDYSSDGAGGPAYFDDVTWPVTPTVVGGPEQVKHGPGQKRCQAIKVRLTGVHTSGVGVPDGEAFKLSSLLLEVGMEQGPFKGLGSGQRV